MTEGEFPEPQPGPSWEQLRIRFACSGGVAVMQLVVFWDFIPTLLPFLWPPVEPVTQWLTFLMISAGSFIVISGLFGTLVADQIYKRYVSSDS